MPTSSKQSVKTNWFVFNPILTVSIFFAVLLAIISLIIHQRYHIVKESREKEIEEMLESVELRLDQLLKNNQNIAYTLALTVEEDGVPRNFEKVSAEIIKRNSHLQALQLVPNGIIKYIYPVKGNEQALGLDLFKTKLINAQAAKRAIALKQLYYQGPVDLVQGGKGVVGRLPIYINKKFWGFSAIVIKLDQLLKIAGIDNNSHEFYKFQLAKINPITGKEEYFLDGNTSFSEADKTKIFEEGDWKVYLKDTRSSYFYYQVKYMIVLGGVLSILCCYLLFKLLQKHRQLQAALTMQGEVLQATESKYKAIFDSAAIGIGRINSITGEFLEANAFLCDLLGYSANELPNKKVKEVIHPDDLELDRRDFKQMLAGKNRGFSSARRYINKNNEVILANSIISPLWAEGESPSNHIIIVEDIGQEVAYENQLIASQKHIEELVNSIEGIVWETSLKGGFTNTFISSKLNEILGYTQEEWNSENGFFFKILYSEDRERVKNYLETELFLRKRHQYEYRVVAKDGSIVWIRDTVNLEPSLEAPEMMRGIMMDITVLKEAEEKLHKSFELVNEQNKRLLNFSYIVSHNLRSHAGNIDGISTLILNAETNAERDEMVKLLRKVVENLNDTLYNLNSIVNIQANIDMVKEPLNLLEFVNSALQTQESQILNRNAEIKVSVPNDVFVYFNKAYLESVLLNLISNALRYSHALRQPVIEINCEPKGAGYIFSIKDNGVGIDLAKNGDRLFGLNQTFHGNKDARGFGLFITKNQIEAMGYSINVESELGEWTKFTIFFG